MIPQRFPGPSRNGLVRDGNPVVASQRNREAEVMGDVNELEPVPFLLAQGTKQAVRNHGTTGGLVVGDGLT